VNHKTSFVRNLIAKVGRLAGFLFGRISWGAPPWLAWCFRKICAFFAACRSHPRASILTTVVLAGLIFGGVKTWLWWESHKPREFAYNPLRKVVVSNASTPAAIAPGAPDKDLLPSPWRISFSGAPVAPLEKIGKEVGDAVTLDPAIPGKWTWPDGSTLQFQPEGHWAPGTKLTASLNLAALAKDIELDKKSISVTTPPLVAELKDFSFYNSPKDPTVYQVVSELNLSHPVSQDALQEKLRMEVIGGTPVFTAGSPLFNVTADPLSARRFFVRSRQIVVPMKEDWVKLIVPTGIYSAVGGAALEKASEAKARVPDKYSGLKIDKAESTLIRTDEGEPQQFIFINTNLDIDSTEINSRIEMWWHPDGWHDQFGNLIFNERVSSATKVARVPVEGEAALNKRHSFRFLQARTDGSLLVRIAEGVKSPGGFEINTRFDKTLSVPVFPKETKLLGKGNILALDGERKLIVQSRGIDHVRITLGRVPDSQFQHLAAISYGSFENPRFSGGFSESNIVQRWSKIVAVPHDNDWQATQTAIDISEAPPLSPPDSLPGGRGIFFVKIEPVEKRSESTDQGIYSRIEEPTDEMSGGNRWYSYGDDNSRTADGWNRASGNASDRFIMVTDLGLLVKAAADGSRDVFVMSLGAGLPVADAVIQVLARNGSVLETTKTDANGHAHLPSFDGLAGERLPVAVTASKAEDTSFFPFNERQLPAMDYSRFDIDGVMASRIKAIEAFVFTERGVYRPGDTVHAGFITRRRDWQPVLEGLPLAVTLTDSRGRNVGSQKTRLPYDGFFTCDFPLSEAAALGVHQISVDVLDASGASMFRLGRIAVRVEEFQPDRMKVATKIDPVPPAGWLDCKVTDASVSVLSLFGEPAPDRRVTMQLELSPADFGFSEWPEFSFYDRSAAESSSRAGRSINLGEMKTDDKGSATFKLPLDTLKDASFRLAILTEAFEREGGRSVRHAMTCLVSPYDSVIGWKPDGDLSNIAKDGERALDLVAVGRDLKPVALANMRRRIIETRQVSVLTKLDNGNYAYVSTAKERTVAEESLDLPASKSSYDLPTDKAGRFRMEIIDAESVLHCAVPFQIIGKGDENVVLEREAELNLQLSKNEVMPGEEIEVFLTAPYSGAGLVTIEREKVTASQWFRTETKGTSVRIRIPEDAEGTYYINAAYVRATSDSEVFHSPLSYAAAPIRVLSTAKKLAFKLDAPQEIRPGTEVSFGITSDRPARLVVYAVDEGIHQITGYQLPKPLDYFLRKQALEVRTQQWLDLLLPEYRFLKTAAAFGGDGDSALSLHLNPFKRRQEPPVVYWSGIVEAGPVRSEVKWNVPDYFNGNLRVMAVGCQADGIGAVESATLVKAPIILQPNAPLFVTPGDEFEVSLSVFNHLPEPGVTPIQVNVMPSAQLEIIGESSVSMPLEGSHEGVAHFRFRAVDQLGAAELNFTATGGGESVKRSSTLSVRPATHHLTSVVTGWFRTGSKEEKVKLKLYPQFRHVEATASIVPLGIARGLEAYVHEYPYGCSEQITSRGMVKLIASTDADFGLSPKEAADAIRSAISQLASRQRSDGGFGYWYAGSSSDFEFHSLYVLHFLTEAKLLGHAVPEELLQGAMKYASRTARANTRNLSDAGMQAYAIYLLARNGENPSPQLLNLRDTLVAKFKDKWEGETAAPWMAATYMLLKKDGEADKLLDLCLKARAAAKKPTKPEWRAYYQTSAMDDLALFYVQCRHFPKRAKSFGIEALEPVMIPLRDQSFNTLSCSYMTLALRAYSDLAKATGVEVSILGLVNGVEKKLAGPGQGILRTDFTPETTSLKFVREQKGDGDIGAFYQVVEQGYGAGKPDKVERSGLEISREITPSKKDEPLRPGDPVDVVLRVRNVSGRNLSSLAIVDLLPAGFEVLAGDLKSGANTVAGTEFAELREDRTLFFLGLGENAEWSVKYRMKAVCSGSFAVPSALVEDMYDRGLHGVSEPGRIEIAAAK
jgi:uncharacterized protein YfaS (alpha-2-macroglobulin family)